VIGVIDGANAAAAMVRATFNLRGGAHFTCYLVPFSCLHQAHQIALICHPVTVCLDGPATSTGDRPHGMILVSGEVAPW